MNICVVGWYYHPEFYDALPNKGGFSIEVVAHRPPSDGFGPHLANVLAVWKHENIGLEWGAYNYYLQERWDGHLPVLFMHDDAIVAPWFFEDVREQARPFDLAFIFRDGDEERDNCGIHGRCVYMSDRLLSRFRPIGFFYDAKNRGDLVTPGFNRGIQRFREDVVWMKNRPSGADLKFGSLFIHADFGYRGKVGEEGQEMRNRLLVGR